MEEEEEEELEVDHYNDGDQPLTRSEIVYNPESMYVCIVVSALQEQIW